MKFTKQSYAATLLILVVGFTACSKDRVRKPGVVTPSTSDGTATPVTSAHTDDVPSADVNGTPLNLIPDSGSTMRFIDGRGLTKFYQNIFTKNAYGYVHCKDNKPEVPQDCTDSIFSKNERPAMGSFDLGTPRMGRSLVNVNPSANLTLNYTRTLRAGLGRECRNLVETELAALKAGNSAANILVKAAAPTADDINNFMLRLLGLAGTTVKIDFPAAGYKSDFDAVVAASKDKNEGSKNAFIGVCISVAMDPLVFIY